MADPGYTERSDPAGILVARGPAHGTRPSAVINLICGVICAAIAAATFVLLAGKAGNTGLSTLSAVTLLGSASVNFSVWSRFQGACRQLADTELWLSPEGATYACAAGRYSVPWSAVRGIEFRHWPGTEGVGAEALCVDTTGWEGPVKQTSSRLNGTGSLAIAIRPGERPAVAQAVQAATGGRFAVQPG